MITKKVKLHMNLFNEVNRHCNRIINQDFHRKNKISMSAINTSFFSESSNVVSTPRTIDVTGCPDPSYSKIFGNCYKLVKAPARWSDARTRCAADGGDLASVENSRANIAASLLSQQAGVNGRFWLGLQDITVG